MPPPTDLPNQVQHNWWPTADNRRSAREGAMLQPALDRLALRSDEKRTSHLATPLQGPAQDSLAHKQMLGRGTQGGPGGGADRGGRGSERGGYWPAWGARRAAHGPYPCVGRVATRRGAPASTLQGDSPRTAHRHRWPEKCMGGWSGDQAVGGASWALYGAPWEACCGWDPAHIVKEYDFWARDDTQTITKL